MAPRCLRAFSEPQTRVTPSCHFLSGPVAERKVRFQTSASQERSQYRIVRSECVWSTEISIFFRDHNRNPCSVYWPVHSRTPRCGCGRSAHSIPPGYLSFGRRHSRHPCPWVLLSQFLEGVGPVSVYLVAYGSSHFTYLCYFGLAIVSCESGEVNK